MKANDNTATQKLKKESLSFKKITLNIKNYARNCRYSFNRMLSIQLVFKFLR